MDKRKKHSKEFKRQAVELSYQEGRTVKGVAEGLGIHPNMLCRWRQEFNLDGKHAFRGNGNLRPEEEEIRRLKKQLSDVTEERDILKKAISIFSKGNP